MLLTGVIIWKSSITSESPDMEIISAELLSYSPPGDVKFATQNFFDC